MTSLGIRCSEGFNGGLMQSFMLEIRDSSSQEVKNNVSSPIPRFAVANLLPGGSYSLSVFAFNSKGRSDPAVMQAAMLRLPEKQLTLEKGETLTFDIIVGNFHNFRLPFHRASKVTTGVDTNAIGGHWPGGRTCHRQLCRCCSLTMFLYDEQE
jgi:hypothetical protein